MQLTHGGDTEGFVASYGRVPLDFSVNTNPLGMPAAARQAAVDALNNAGGYPDPLCRRLCAALAQHHGGGIQPGMVLCGNGAADLIFRLVYAKRPGLALVTAPAFAEYEAALAAVGCGVRRHVLWPEEAFALTERILADITPEVDMLFLCEPANPTGQVTEHCLLEKVMERCTKTGTLLVVDECFMGFLPQRQALSMAGWVAKSQGIVVLNAFTKLYAMAGLRLGYCLCSNTALLEAMRKSQQPWAVSAPAQAAGVAALADGGYLQQTATWLAEERPCLQQELAALGLRLYGSKANFCFFYTAIPHFFEGLARQGILLRNCQNYPGLGAGYYRAAVRLREENRRLVAGVRQVAEGKG